MKKILIYYSFIIVTLMVIAGFLGAKDITQIITATLFFPLFIYFASKVSPKKNKAIIIPQETVLKPIKQRTEEVRLTKEGVDIDRRAFLKLIGTAGMSLFLFSVFTRKAEAAFFGSVPGPGTVSLKDSQGTKIDPAEKHPTDGYLLAEYEDGETYSYAGYTNKIGAWYIVRDDSTSYRYTRGDSAFSTSWTNRASLSYDYYDNIF